MALKTVIRRRLRSFTLRNFIEERRATPLRTRRVIAKLYASQLH